MEIKAQAVWPQDVVKPVEEAVALCAAKSLELRRKKLQDTAAALKAQAQPYGTKFEQGVQERKSLLLKASTPKSSASDTRIRATWWSLRPSATGPLVEWL